MLHLKSQNTMFQLFLLLKFTTILFSMVNSSPPEDPIICSSINRNCTITNSYGAFPDRSVCRAADVAYPTTEEELISVVAMATEAKRKMKVATRFSHSIPKLVCLDGDEGLLISTKFLNRKLEIDHMRMTISVESGVTLRQLINEATKVGLALPYVPYWWGLTVGGMLGTGAHGSTLLGDGSSVQDYVIQIRIVTPAGPEEGYGKVRTIMSGDPDLKAARVSLGVLGVISQVSFDGLILGTCLDSLNDELIEVCSWDPRVKGLFFHQTAVSISMSKVKSFIQDVQKLVELVPKALCGVDLYNGILMRYVKASTAYLGKQEDAVDFDITYYRSKDPMSPRLYGDILEEVEQIGLFKYGGLPHWGKNRNVAFEGVINKYGNAEEFLKVKQDYDPQGLFSSGWTDQVLGLRDRVTIVREGCALEGLCVCSQDIHCAPSKGYFCRPGKVYEKARVCAR
ncbi:hypothetical protein RHSIM_RhsimUnG0236000 [Rhododendron simsii]|uniref:L-gulonolactone oxidase n=1 Tax=Rhododendron simsii TaxID=118357 RepID=A0A834FV96_RHOSS|nr:hypothetical protein RHSIM_RhsimUnG0236000 [Rhododendron simsii]